MKKRTVKLLSLMMVTTFLATSTITTEAAGTGAYQKIKTGDKISKKESANKGDYVEGQALVLYKDNKISTKAAAQRALNVSDISVSKVWNFEYAECGFCTVKCDYNITYSRIGYFEDIKHEEVN